MNDAQKVTAILKVTAEFYDPNATPETVRYAVEQTLEDSRFDVEVVNLSQPIKIAYEGPVGIYTRIGDVPDTNAGKWISVKDRLPEPTDEYTDYIVHIIDDEGNWAIGIAEYEIALGVGFWRIGPDGNTLPDGMYITHWMNTPEPPPEEEA